MVHHAFGMILSTLLGDKNNTNQLKTMKNNKRTCRNCNKSIDHKHINAKFCGQKCKDKYHNRTNPRGIFAHKKAKCY